MPSSKRRLASVSLLVRDYDEAIDFFKTKLGFRLLKDDYIESQQKRWVEIGFDNAGCTIILAKASNDEQEKSVGNQTGGRVGFFIHTDDLQRDLAELHQNGVVLVREPKIESYGTVAVFKDLYGNHWDLIEPAA